MEYSGIFYISLGEREKIVTSSGKPFKETPWNLVVHSLEIRDPINWRLTPASKVPRREVGGPAYLTWE